MFSMIAGLVAVVFLVMGVPAQAATESGVRATLPELAAEDRMRPATPLGEVFAYVVGIRDASEFPDNDAQSIKLCPNLAQEIRQTKSQKLAHIRVRGGAVAGTDWKYVERDTLANIPDDLLTHLEKDKVVLVRIPQGCAGTNIVTVVH